MRLVVEELPLRGRDLAVDDTTTWAREAAAIAFDVDAARVAGVSGHLHVARQRRQEVEVTVRLTASAPLRCDRCGAEGLLTLSVDEVLTYRPQEQAPDADAKPSKSKRPEIALEEEDLDVGWYEGGAVELVDVAGEALTLAMPPRVTCAELGGDVAACDASVDSILGSTNADDSPSDGSNGSAGGHPAFAILSKLR